MPIGSCFCKKITFFIQHKANKTNQVSDALSRRVILFISIQYVIIGMESLQNLYESNAKFANPWKRCHLNTLFVDYNI